MGVRQPSLQRICVAQDGRLKANFSDNSILVLNASGSGFVHLHPGKESPSCSPAVTYPIPKSGNLGNRTEAPNNISRQLSEYALSRHLPQLRVALEFRNMHLDQPFFCQPLLRKEPQPQGLSLGFLITELWWPSSAAEALAAGLVQQLPDGRTAVSTSDGSARMVLHHHRRRFAICYPLLVEESRTEGKFPYVWHTQVFSLQDYPDRWQAAAELLLQIADQLAEEAHTQEAAAATTWLSLPSAQQPLPHKLQQSCLDDPHRKDVQQQQYVRCTVLPVATQRGLAGSSGTFEGGSWWLEPTLTLFPPNDIIVLEWTPSALYQFYPSTCEVEVWVTHDDSCLTSIKHGRYLRHFRCLEGSSRVADQLYAASAVPESVWARPPLCQPHLPPAGAASDLKDLKLSTEDSPAASNERPDSSRYPLATLAAHALKLREQMRMLVAAQGAVTAADSLGGAHRRHEAHCPTAPHSIENSFGVLSDRVVEQAEVPGQSAFTAYEDGRVRAIFTDRTILHVNAAHSHCKVYLPDGACVMVATDNPVGVEPYVQAVAEFASWAFKTVEQRAQCERMQARIEAELGAAHRMAILLGAKVVHRLSHQAQIPCFPTQVGALQAGSAQKGRGLPALRPAPLEDESFPELGNVCYRAGGASALGNNTLKLLPSPAADPEDHAPACKSGTELAGGVVASRASSPSNQASSVQEMVERLLQENARLLQRLG